MHHHFCGGKRGLRRKASSTRLPSTAPSWGWGPNFSAHLAHWITPALLATFWLCVTSAPADDKGLGLLSLEKYLSLLQALLQHQLQGGAFWLTGLYGTTEELLPWKDKPSELLRCGLRGKTQQELP